jgi:uncharacterized protein (TIGR00251 family)
VTERSSASWVSRQADGVRLAVRVTPRAASSAVEGIEIDAVGRPYLAVRLTAPPQSGRANAALIKLLAKRWRLPASDFRLVAGAAARRKIVDVQGPPAELVAKLEAIERRAEVLAGAGL